LRRRTAELEAENAVIPELRKRVAELELETENAEIPELRKKVVEVEARLVILEQRPLQNDNTPNDNAPNDNTSNFNLITNHHGKSLEDKKTDDFLNEVHKKRIGDDIRRHNKEKKLQRESADQDSTSDTVYVSETVNNIEKSYEPEINKITNCTSSESSLSGRNPKKYCKFHGGFETR
jgi:hypothetical protein